MENLRAFLGKLDLLEIDGFEYENELGGGSALSSLYSRHGEKVVFKFLISPRNPIELERFKLEFSVLEKNRANTIRTKEGFVPDPDKRHFIGPKSSYPLPNIAVPLQSRLSNQINFFAYSYEEGQLLSSVDTAHFSTDEKIFLLYRIASGLSYFNQTGYSHRDLHPENIILLDDYDMPNSNRYMALNDPRVKFLDMGNCQRTNLEDDWLYRIERNLDEDAVFQDNNKRLLASFASMPPDFLEKGEGTINYDSWSFGVLAYKILFNELPFSPQQIGDVTLLRNERKFSENYQSNLKSVTLGMQLVLNHLLSPRGEERPSIHTIVRLFSWLVDRKEDFQERNFICQVIHNNGFDPNHDPIDDIY
jgi:serine/threonine protein kinase